MENLNFYKYVNDISILVITNKGKLKRLYCPFAVSIKEKSIGQSIPKRFLIVDKIATDGDKNIYYIIANEKYLYSGFIINM